jgi:molybdenum cofactor cytidylyltransferase
VTVAAVVLAAGGGSRFLGDSHKLLAPLGGRPVVVWAVDAALSANLDETVVVTGAVDLRDALAGRPVTLLHNDAWASGIATSLAVAVDHATAAGHDAIVVGLGDQPFVPAEAWMAVASASAPADGGTPIVVATYDGQRRNPVRLGRDVWALLARDGDDGARALMRRQPHLVGEVACAGSPADVDTVEDLERWS